MRHTFARWGDFSWPLVVGVAAFLFAIDYSNNLLNDGDTFWHLATGRWILQHGEIPHVDPFSHTMHGAAWTSHEWLSAVLFYLAFKLAGWFGVVLLTATAFAGTLAYQARFLLRYVEPAYVLIFFILAVGMIAPHLLARPHLLAMPLLVVWTGGLIRASEEGRVPSPWLLVAMLLWANLHGSFTLGIALTAAFGVEAVLRAHKNDDKWLVVLRRWMIFLVLAGFVGALTPHGLQGYAFTVNVLGLSYALANIGEWLPPNFQNFQFLELWLILLLAALFVRGLRISPVRLAILLGLVHLSLTHFRYVPLLGLLAPLLMASAIGKQWVAPPDRAKQTETLDRFFNRHAQPASMQAMVVVFLLTASLAYYKVQQQGVAPPDKRHPIAAVKAANELGIKGPVLNAYSFGGYLIFSGIPVFMDGRADMYGDSFFKRYLEALRHPGSEGLVKLLDDYHVQWTLLAPSTPAVDYLDVLPGWRRAYADETAVVHVRNTGTLQK